MLEFLSSNLLTILSILIGAGVSYVFYRLQKRDIISAKEERYRQAKQELVEAIESLIINKQKVRAQTINNLISSTERLFKVDLSSGNSPSSLYQDVSLRLQTSRHLNVSQKTEYTSDIENLITKTNKKVTEVEPDISRILGAVEEAQEFIKRQEPQLAIKKLNATKKLLKKIDAGETEFEGNSYSLILFASLLAGVLAIVAFSILINNNSGDLSGLLSFALLAPVLVLFTSFARRMVRRIYDE